jgi:hypothetical protein
VRRRAAIAPAVSGLLGGLLFAPAISSGRLADDFVLLRTVRRMSGVLSPFSHNDLGQPAGSGHFYRPVWVLWNAIVYKVSHDPVLAHLANLVLFAVVVAEVSLLVRELAGPRAGLAAGALFAVLPIHGESVAWISGDTDLLAVALGLGAMLGALLIRREWPRDLVVITLTAAALLSKEEAAVLPVLLALVAWAGRPRRIQTSRWREPLVMLAAIVTVLVIRSLVIHGFGGYGGQQLTVKRAAGSLASFSVAALSAPQLQVLAHLVLLVVPVGIAVLLAIGIRRLWRVTQGGSSARLAVAGVAWFFVAIALVLNQPLNLNTGNGNRLLLLPSVGLALTAGVLIDRGLAGLVNPSRRRAACGALAVLATACAVSCVLGALDWRTAGSESRRLIADVERLGPRGARLAALSVPSDYRQAHLYPDALQEALRESGRPDLTLVQCAPIHALRLLPGQVSFSHVGGGGYLGRTTSASPFDFPVLGSGGVQIDAGCLFVRLPDPQSAPGTGLRAAVRTPPGPWLPIYFDGRDMRLAR